MRSGYSTVYRLRRVFLSITPPREIVTGRALDLNKHCKVQLGSYVEAHEDKVVTNTYHPRTFTGIYLGPTGNIQGKLKVLDIKTSAVKKP